MMSRKVFKSILLSLVVIGILGIHVSSEGQKRAEKTAQLLLKALRPTARATEGITRVPVGVLKELSKRFRSQERLENVLVKLDNPSATKALAYGPAQTEVAAERAVNNIPPIRHSLKELSHADKEQIERVFKEGLKDWTNKELHRVYPYRSGLHNQDRQSLLNRATQKTNQIYAFLDLPLPRQKTYPNIRGYSLNLEDRPSDAVGKVKTPNLPAPDVVSTNKSLPDIVFDAASR